MKFAIYAVLVLTVAVTLSQAQQPSGPSLDFTMNYINNSLEVGAISLEGTKLTLSFYVWGSGHKTIPGGDGDTTKSYYYIDLIGARSWTIRGFASIVCPTNSQGQLVHCVRHHAVDGKTGRTNDSGTDVSLDLQIDAGGNALKVKDVVNALNHLIALVSARHDAVLKQQLQQNQSDPFANRSN